MYVVTAIVIIAVSIQLLTSHVAEGHPARPHLPLCTEEKKFGEETRLQCIVFASQFLDYNDIRTFTALHANTEKFNVSIHCYSGGVVRLPWPFFANNIVSLKVSGCITEGLLSERATPSVYPNEIRRVEMTNIKHNVTWKEFYDSIINLKAFPQEFNCGHTEANVQIFRNIDYIFPPPGLEEMKIIDELLSANTLKDFLSDSTICSYPKLTYLEESGSRSFSAFHMKFVEANKYPKLEAYILRNNSLNSIPQELQNIQNGFAPRLSLLDLADNEIQTVNILLGEPGKTQLVINLQRNFIRTISKQLIAELQKSTTTILDLRANPLECSCELFAYGKYLLKLSQNALAQEIYRELMCSKIENGIAQQFHIDESGVSSAPCHP